MFAALGRANDFKVPSNCSYEDNLTEEVDCKGRWQYLKIKLVVDDLAYNLNLKIIHAVAITLESHVVILWSAG